MYSMFHFSYRLGFYILDGFIDISDVLDYSCYFLSIVIHAYSINLLVCVSACLRKKINKCENEFLSSQHPGAIPLLDSRGQYHLSSCSVVHFLFKFCLHFLVMDYISIWVSVGLCEVSTLYPLHAGIVIARKERRRISG